MSCSDTDHPKHQVCCLKGRRLFDCVCVWIDLDGEKYSAFDWPCTVHIVFFLFLFINFLFLPMYKRQKPAFIFYSRTQSEGFTDSRDRIWIEMMHQKQMKRNDEMIFVFFKRQWCVPSDLFCFTPNMERIREVERCWILLPLVFLKQTQGNDMFNTVSTFIWTEI